MAHYAVFAIVILVVFLLMLYYHIHSSVFRSVSLDIDSILLLWLHSWIPFRAATRTNDTRDLQFGFFTAYLSFMGFYLVYYCDNIIITISLYHFVLLVPENCMVCHIVDHRFKTLRLCAILRFMISNCIQHCFPSGIPQS